MLVCSTGRFERASASFRAFLVLALIGTTPAAALAQGTQQSHWGVGGSFTPSWTSRDDLREALYNFEGEGTVEGTEFTVGVVRGSTRGGDWGVSYVQKPFKDGSGSTLSEEGFTETRSTQGVALTGVEVHWFIAFATIKDRVQIGLNVGGGVASVKGEILQTQEYEVPPVPGFPGQAFNYCSFAPPGTSCEITASGYKLTEVRPAKDVMYPFNPLAKLEVQSALIVTPALKIKIGFGLNLPSATSVRIGAVYLIGAK